MRIALVKVLLAIALCTSCGDSTSPMTPDGGMVSPDASAGHGIVRVEIAPVSVFLTAAGQTRVLVARAFDAQGTEKTVPLTWSSSRADDVTVNADGRLVANRIGSAQIFAEAGGVRSPPALVVVAEPAAGAVLVSDAQVVSVEPPVLAEAEVPGVGTHYDVRLRDVSPVPEPGTIMLASETAPIAGRVISTRDDGGVLVVTLALAPLYELLSSYHLDLSIDLAPYAVKVMEESPAPLAGPAALALVPDTSPIAPFKALDCDGSIKAALFKQKIDFGVENKLRVEIRNDKDPGTPPGYSKLALTGSLALTGTVEVGLNANISVTGSCLAQASVDLPIFGWLSVVVMPAVRLGLGVELKATLTVATATLGMTGSVGVTPNVGWECGPIPLTCHGLSELGRLNDLKPKVEAPSLTGMRIDASGQFFVLVGLDLSFLSGLGGHFSIAEAKIGPKQSGKSLAFESDQAHEAALRSSYDLVLLGTLEPGPGLKAAIKKVINDDAVGVTIQAKIELPISESPKGTFSVDKVRTGVGKKVRLTVDLDPRTIYYWQLDYNVDSIRFRRLVEGGSTYEEVESLVIRPTATNQTRFVVDWTPTEADVGKNELAAFVRTTLPILPDLEISEDSRKKVEVLCFTPSGKPQVAGRPASTCEDAWTSTMTYELRHPDGFVPVHGDASLTWKRIPGIPGGPPMYEATGIIGFELGNSSTDCTLMQEPKTFTFPNADPQTLGGIYIDYEQTPPFYSFGVSIGLAFTTTYTCPGGEPVVTHFTSYPFGFVGWGNFTDENDTGFSGSHSAGGETNTWAFSRQ